MRTIRSASNLDDLLPAVAEALVEDVRADWCRIWTTEGADEAFRSRATVGDWPESDGPLVEYVLEQARGSLVWSEGRLVSPNLYVAPLLASDRALGAVAVGGATLDPDGLAGEHLEAAAQLIGLAVREAEVLGRLRFTEQRLRETQGMLLQAERLAGVGEETGRFVEELRGPLTTIAESARRIAEAGAEDDRNARLASLVFREVQRVEALLDEQSTRTKVGRPRLDMVDLPGLVKECIQQIREEAELRGVRLEESHEAELSKILLDPEKITQVFRNVIQNSLDPLERGERLLIKTYRSSGRLVVEVATDGAGLGGDLLDRLFVPFATRRPGGNGLGLAVARQIVVDHGGEIDVKSGDTWSVVFSIRFPIAENRDRRRANDRRRKDRRAA
ncbi:MAG: ATP-binding protein [Candidatus Eisenbacteria bacterium]